MEETAWRKSIIKKENETSGKTWQTNDGYVSKLIYIRLLINVFYLVEHTVFNFSIHTFNGPLRLSNILVSLGALQIGMSYNP